MHTFFRAPSGAARRRTFGAISLAFTAAAAGACGAAPAPAPAAAPAPEEAIHPRYVSEVEAIADRPSVQRAFRVIEALEPRTQQDLVYLTEIPAPPFGEEARAAAYLEMLREAGVDTAYIDDEGNVVAVRRGASGERTVAVSGHLDTVFQEGTDVTVRTRGDTLFAPGVGDDSRGLVVALTVLRAMNAAQIETEADIWFVGTVGEEGLGDLRGVKHLFRDGGPGINSFISVDGAGDARVVNAALGSRRYRVTFRGPGGHSWGDFGMANPAHALGHAIERFDRAASAYVAEGPRTSYNVGRIGGGTSINSVPGEAWMEVDMRSVDHERLMGLDSLFTAVMEATLADRGGAELELELDRVGDRPSGVIPADAPLVQRAMAAARFMGFEPELARASTDANVPISLGVPAVTTGRGGAGGGAHSLDEWWLNEEGHLAIQRTLLLLLAEAGLPE